MAEAGQRSSLIENLINPENRSATASMEINKLCDLIRETSFEIHKFLRSGHLEKVYENALAHVSQELEYNSCSSTHWTSVTRMEHC